jgi:malate synthase
MSVTTRNIAQAGVEVLAPVPAEYQSVLTPEALAFVAALHRAFDGRRRELLARGQAEPAQGRLPDFHPETRDVRQSAWLVAPLPDYKDLP